MFGPKPCPVCEAIRDAKDNEIARLYVQLDTALARLLELAEPGANARLAAATRLSGAQAIQPRKEKHPLDAAKEALLKSQQPAPLPGFDH